MEFYEAVRKRRMVRNFTDQPVEPAAVERVLDAARRGPSAGFTQGQDFVAVTDPRTKEESRAFATRRVMSKPGSIRSSLGPRC
jgi:nitroreductase